MTDSPIDSAFTSPCSDASLRVTLAESQVEVTLLKAELLRTKQRLLAAEEALRTNGRLRDSGLVTPTLRAAPRSLRPSGTVCKPSTVTSLSPEDVQSIAPAEELRRA